MATDPWIEAGRKWRAMVVQRDEECLLSTFLEGSWEYEVVVSSCLLILQSPVDQLHDMMA